MAVADLDIPLSTDSAELRSWQSRQFFGTRILILRDKLRDDQRAKFNALPYARKCWVIGRMIEKGLMI